MIAAAEVDEAATATTAAKTAGTFALNGAAGATPWKAVVELTPSPVTVVLTPEGQRRCRRLRLCRRNNALVAGGDTISDYTAGTDLLSFSGLNM